MYTVQIQYIDGSGEGIEFYFLKPATTFARKTIAADESILCINILDESDTSLATFENIET